MSKSLQIDTRKYGFFSSMFQVIDNIRYCELNNIKPILNLGDLFQYQNNNQNKWNLFFENINDGIHEQEHIKITDMTHNANFLLDDYILVGPSKNDYRLKLWNLRRTENDPMLLDIHRKSINQMIIKYFKPIENINKIINDFSAKFGKTLGVHFRATDYESNITHFMNEIETEYISHKYDNIFVASDNQTHIDTISKRFGNCIFYETKRRCIENHNRAIVYSMENDDKINHGVDVLIESILLSKCHHLICSNSNVSGFALYNNPELTFKTIYYSPSGG